MRASTEPGVPYLAYEARPGDTHCVPVVPGLSWIGRSFTASLRLEDPTVSRRHAILHRSSRRVTVADDRSARGVLVNGEHVQWRELSDGDELRVGRFSLFFLYK